MKERQTDRREVDGEGEDDKRHDPEHGLHGSQVGVVETRLCTQLKNVTKNDFIQQTATTSLITTELCCVSTACWVKDSPPG